MEISAALIAYLKERSKIKDDSFFCGKKISDPELSSLQKAMDGLYLPLKEMLRASSKGWKIQMGFGQCSATADQYIALLPPGQKVSNGIYFCICFGHKGEGCVFGAMTSLTQITNSVSPVIRAKAKKISSKLTEWEMLSPFTIDIKKWNNAFLLPLEIDIAQLENTPADAEKTFSNHFIKSCLLIEQSIKSC